MPLYALFTAVAAGGVKVSGKYSKLISQYAVVKVKVKQSHLHTWTDPEGSRRLKL
jgi:hypothetical protein